MTKDPRQSPSATEEKYWCSRTGKLFPHAAVLVRVKIKDRVKFRVRVRVRSRLKIRVRIRARVKVSVSVSYIMTIWRWEDFSRCDKFPTTPDPLSVRVHIE